MSKTKLNKAQEKRLQIQRRKWEAKGYDLLWEDLEKHLVFELAKQKKEIIEKVENILENKVRVYAKINFCEECRKQPALKKNELIMYFEKDLDQAIKTIKD